MLSVGAAASAGSGRLDQTVSNEITTSRVTYTCETRFGDRHHRYTLLFQFASRFSCVCRIL